MAVDRAKIAVHVGGNGAPVLMLHGFSQNHMASEKVASALSAMGPFFVNRLFEQIPFECSPFVLRRG